MIMVMKRSHCSLMKIRDRNFHVFNHGNLNPVFGNLSIPTKINQKYLNGTQFGDKKFFDKNVTSSKRRHKNSMKCSIAKFLNQDGRPDRYWKLKKMMENSANTPHPTRERTHRHRSIPEIAVLCHLPRKTSQLPAEPEEWPKR